jgi:hypothetical protein
MMKRAIPALLAASSSGGIATRAVAGFGKKALDATLAEITGQDYHRAAVSLFIIRDMLEYRTVSDPDSLLRIKNVLRSALSSPDADVRMNAMVPIEYLQDREEFVPILKELAAHDPYIPTDMPAIPGTKEDDRYMVRRGAQLLLRKIENQELPIVDRGVHP